ncbi:MAG: PAS domain S-box protein [Actinomycetes bacterium]
MTSRYEALLAALSAGVVVHAADTAIIEANDRARALLGLQDLEGRLATDPSWVFLEADHSPMALERFPVMQVISSMEPVHGLTMIVRPSAGPDVWLEVNALPSVDDSGQLEQVTVTFIDVTDRENANRALIVDIEDRVRVEEELVRVSGYARSLLEASLDPLVTISPGGVITDVNAATVTATGVPRQALIGSDFAGYFTDPDQARAGYREAFAAGSVTDYPLAIRNVDGSVTDVLYNASVYRDPDGDVAGVFAAARDITERKAAQQALVAGEELLRAVLDTSPDTTIRIGADGLVEFVNHRVVEISGIPAERWIGKTFEEMGYPAELAQSWDVHRRTVFTTGEPVTFEFEIDNAEGHRWYETSVAPEFGPDGSVAHVIESSRDVTERKSAEEVVARESRHRMAAEAEVRQLNAVLEQRVEQRTDEIRRANAELEAFTYSVSHDLRSPLRAMSGFSEALLEEYSDTLDETGRGYAHRIEAASRQMAGLIDDLLQLSRVSRAVLHVEGVDVSAECATILEGLADRDPDRRVQVVIEPGMKARGDGPLLHTVLENLLDNAWKYTSKRPDACIEVGTETVTDAPFCLVVRDNGAGFDPAYSDKLFQPFQRLHSSSEFPGNGIGLASARRIVERHGGRIWAEAAVDEGATFRFTLNPSEQT